MDRTKIKTDGQKAAMIKKTPEQILSMTALELGAAIKAGKLTAVEAVKAVMEQADKTDGSLHAYLTFPGREDYGASGSAAGEPDKDAEEKILLAAAEIQRRIEAGDPARRMYREAPPAAARLPWQRERRLSRLAPIPAAVSGSRLPIAA